jgi:hypothetical protein
MKWENAKAWENKLQYNNRKNLSFIQSLSNEEKVSIISAAQTLGIKLPSVVLKLPGSLRIIRAKTICVLCRTETIQYLKLVKYSDGSWRKEGEIEEAELENFPAIRIESLEGKVPHCWNCRTVLLTFEKAKLVELVLHMNFSMLSRTEAWKALQLSMKVKELNALSEEV